MSDNPTVDPQSKFQVVISPQALPGCCLFCRNGNAEWYVDTGSYEEFYGVVYICCDCILQISTQVGWVTPERRVELEEKVMELTGHLLNANDRIHSLELIINGYTALNLSLDVDVPVLPTDSVSSSVSDEGLNEGDGSDSQPGEDALGERESITFEQTNDEGMDDVRSDGKPEDFRLSL